MAENTLCNAYCTNTHKTNLDITKQHSFWALCGNKWVPKVRWPPRGRAGGLLTQRRTKRPTPVEIP